MTRKLPSPYPRRGTGAISRRACAIVLRAALTQLCFSRDRVRIDFDHGVWWATNTWTGDQWYAQDTADGIRFISGRMES